MSRANRRPPHRQPRVVRTVAPDPGRRLVHGVPVGVPPQVLDWPGEDPEDREIRLAHGFAHSAPGDAVCAYGCGLTHSEVGARGVLVCASGQPPAAVSPDCQIGECNNCPGCEHDCGEARP